MNLQRATLVASPRRLLQARTCSYSLACLYSRALVDSGHTLLQPRTPTKGLSQALQLLLDQALFPSLAAVMHDPVPPCNAAESLPHYLGPPSFACLLAKLTVPRTLSAYTPQLAARSEALVRRRAGQPEHAPQAWVKLGFGLRDAGAAVCSARPRARRLRLAMAGSSAREVGLPSVHADDASTHHARVHGLDRRLDVAVSRPNRQSSQQRRAWQCAGCVGTADASHQAVQAVAHVQLLHTARLYAVPQSAELLHRQRIHDVTRRPPLHTQSRHQSRGCMIKRGSVPWQVTAWPRGLGIDRHCADRACKHAPQRSPRWAACQAP